MATVHLVVREDGGDYHLDKVRIADFAADGTKVLAVGVSDGVTHLIDLGPDGVWSPDENGILVLRPNRGAAWLRLYRDWVFAEDRKFKRPAPGRVHVM